MTNYYVQEVFNYKGIFERVGFDLFSFYIIAFNLTNQPMGVKYSISCIQLSVILSWIQTANASSEQMLTQPLATKKNWLPF